MTDMEASVRGRETSSLVQSRGHVPLQLWTPVRFLRTGDSAGICTDNCQILLPDGGDQFPNRVPQHLERAQA